MCFSAQLCIEECLAGIYYTDSSDGNVYCGVAPGTNIKAGDPGWPCDLAKGGSDCTSGVCGNASNGIVTQSICK